MKITDTIGLEELALVLDIVRTFRRQKGLLGIKFAEQGSIYGRSQIVEDLIRKGFIKEGSKKSHWSDYRYCSPTEKAIEEIDAVLGFMNLRSSSDASNT